MKTFFNKKLVLSLGDQIHAVHADFDTALFVSEASKGLNKLELKARSQHIARALSSQLPASNQTTRINQRVDGGVGAIQDLIYQSGRLSDYHLNVSGGDLKTN